MPAASAHAPGAKPVTFHSANVEKNIRAVVAVIVLFRADIGETLAVLDGPYLGYNLDLSSENKIHFPLKSSISISDGTTRLEVISFLKVAGQTTIR
jgi:hypothetical protein